MSKGFGSTSEVHMVRARSWAKAFRLEAKATRSALKRQNCIQALNSLLETQRAHARLTSEKVGAGRQLGAAGRGAVENLVGKFKKACLRK